jgi:hypothetical protein
MLFSWQEKENLEKVDTERSMDDPHDHLGPALRQVSNAVNNRNESLRIPLNNKNGYFFSKGVTHYRGCHSLEGMSVFIIRGVIY